MSTVRQVDTRDKLCVARNRAGAASTAPLMAPGGLVLMHADRTPGPPRTDEPITVTLRRGQWMVLLGAASNYDERVPLEQGDGGACLDAIRAALSREPEAEWQYRAIKRSAGLSSAVKPSEQEAREAGRFTFGPDAALVVERRVKAGEWETLPDA